MPKKALWLLLLIPMAGLLSWALRERPPRPQLKRFRAPSRKGWVAKAGSQLKRFTPSRSTPTPGTRRDADDGLVYEVRREGVIRFAGERPVPPKPAAASAGAGDAPAPRPAPPARADAAAGGGWIYIITVSKQEIGTAIYEGFMLPEEPIRDIVLAVDHLGNVYENATPLADGALRVNSGRRRGFRSLGDFLAAPVGGSSLSGWRRLKPEELDWQAQKLLRRTAKLRPPVKKD